MLALVGATPPRSAIVLRLTWTVACMFVSFLKLCQASAAAHASHDAYALIGVHSHGSLGAVLISQHGCCVQDREGMLQHIERRPDAPWKAGAMWSFKNESRVFGSPWFDAAYERACGQAESGSLAAVLSSMRSCYTPWQRT